MKCRGEIDIPDEPQSFLIVFQSLLFRILIETL